MTEGTQALLAALQFGDGQFPGGGFAFSWGLETLVADRQIQRGQFGDFLQGQLRGRWSSFDRVVVAHAHRAASSRDLLIDLDDRVDAMSTVQAARRGSVRAGQALLGTHRRLGTPGSAMLREAIDAGLAHGHLPVVQGLVLAGVGLSMSAALALSAYGLATGLASAGIRLGLIGHLDGQHAIAALRPWLSDLIESPIPDLDELGSFAPMADLAMMRHPDQSQRLFSN